MVIFEGLFKKTLYFPGCSAKFEAVNVQKRHEQLLNKFGIKYIKLAELEVCCGKPAKDFGYVEDFKKLVKLNNDNFKANGVKKIITSCPMCYMMIQKHYDDFEVEHISTTILKNIGKIDKNYQNEAITIFDACNPMKLPELYENPRKILELVGFKVVELERNREKSLNSGKSLKLISPKTAKAMAENVLENVKTKRVVTIDAGCYAHLNENAKNVKVIELSEVLV
jgi:Fe-S oxidoreductase